VLSTVSEVLFQDISRSAQYLAIDQSADVSNLDLSEVQTRIVRRKKAIPDVRQEPMLIVVESHSFLLFSFID